MAFTLTLDKPGEAPAPKLRLSLTKGTTFKVQISWDCHADHQDDLDIHALATWNDGSGAKLRAQENILSTFNVKATNGVGILSMNPDKSFSTLGGALHHSGDVRIQGKESEVITIDGSKIPQGVNEIPLFATVFKAEHGDEHESDHDEDEEAAFADIDICIVKIMDASGAEIGTYTLSKEFGEFNVVQLGCLMLGDQGWEYAPIGRGFMGDLNQVLEFFG